MGQLSSNRKGCLRAFPSAIASNSVVSHSCHRCTEGNTDAWLRKDRLCLSLFHPLSEKALCSQALFPEGQPGKTSAPCSGTQGWSRSRTKIRGVGCRPWPIKYLSTTTHGVGPIIAKMMSFGIPVNLSSQTSVLVCVVFGGRSAHAKGNRKCVPERL